MSTGIVPDLAFFSALLHPQPRMSKKLIIPPLPRDDMTTEEKIDFYWEQGVPLDVKLGPKHYGLRINRPLRLVTPRQLELGAYLTDPPHGLGRAEHFRRFLAHTWPKFAGDESWNPWTARIIAALTEHKHVVRFGGQTIRTVMLTGCAAASKTFTVGMFACGWWMIDPCNSIVILTSTTSKMVRRRIWPVVQQLFENGHNDQGEQGEWGHRVESQTTIQASKGDDLHAIFAKAVAEGETQKAATDIRGMHAPRIMLVIDEANATPEAIFETIPNLRKSCRELIVVVIGNPVSHMDPHGQACEPLLGYSSLNVDMSYEWKTKGVDRWQLEPGICLRFDGKDSPNVQAGADKWPFLYGIGDWQRASDSTKEKTLGYWSQDRGFWPPDGFRNTIFSESLLAKYDPSAGAPFVFISRKKIIGFLDVAFTGDEPVLQFAEFGDIDGTGKMGVQLLDPITVPINVASRDEADYQLARFCIEACRSRGMIPSDFGLDRSGNGSGVAAIMCAEWGPVLQIEFGSMATERPATTADHRPSREVYADRVTEMWYSAREFLEAGQLRGVNLMARVEFCSREFKQTGRRWKLFPKLDVKALLGRSPDHSDAIAGVVDVARSSGASANTRNASRSAQDWQKVIREAEAALEGCEGQPGGFMPMRRIDLFDRSMEEVDTFD